MSVGTDSEEKSLSIYLTGVLLFLFIPLVLFLFLRYPMGVRLSFLIAISLMLGHRFVAIPFMNRYRLKRCLWCGKTERPRTNLEVHAGKSLQFEFCKNGCFSNAKRFFDFCNRYKTLLRIGIFIPLLWYLITMMMVSYELFSFPYDWNNFIFRFFIACSVVAISFLFKTGHEVSNPHFPFPIHNLFLLGIRNTLMVFRLVGIWWILAGLYFLIQKLDLVRSSL
jgi:hypothetical protein